VGVREGSQVGHADGCENILAPAPRFEVTAKTDRGMEEPNDKKQRDVCSTMQCNLRIEAESGNKEYRMFNCAKALPQL
jgi:hypothetical protein